MSEKKKDGRRRSKLGSSGSSEDRCSLLENNDDESDNDMDIATAEQKRDLLKEKSKASRKSSRITDNEASQASSSRVSQNDIAGTSGVKLRQHSTSPDKKDLSRKEKLDRRRKRGASTNDPEGQPENQLRKTRDPTEDEVMHEVFLPNTELRNEMNNHNEGRRTGYTNYAMKHQLSDETEDNILEEVNLPVRESRSAESNVAQRQNEARKKRTTRSCNTRLGGSQRRDSPPGSPPGKPNVITRAMKSVKKKLGLK